MTSTIAFDSRVPELIAGLLKQAERHETPCGDGTVVWRSWGRGPRDLILLHGGAGSWTHWARNIPELSRHFRLWVPDIRGMLAGHWAAFAPERIERIVAAAAAGTALGTPPMEAMRSWRKVEDPAERREVHRQNLRTWMLHDPSRADDLAAWIAQQSVEKDRLRNREVSTTDSLLRVMPAVRCTAHAICGSEDVLYKSAQKELEEAMLRAGFDSFTWLPDAGHWSAFEQPAAFNEIALRLLDA